MSLKYKEIKGKNTEIDFPVCRLNKKSGLIVWFFDQTSGVVIQDSSDGWGVGYTRNCWTPCFDKMWTAVKVKCKD
jgi:hypothetical protein